MTNKTLKEFITQVESDMGCCSPNNYVLSENLKLQGYRILNKLELKELEEGKLKGKKIFIAIPENFSHTVISYEYNELFPKTSDHFSKYATYVIKNEYQ